MALLNYRPATTPQFAADNRSFSAGAVRAAYPAPKTAWWYDSAGNRQTKALEGELASATNVSNQNGQLVVSGPFGQRTFGSSSVSSAAPGTPGAKSPAGQEPPKFGLVVKDPEIEKVAKEGLQRTLGATAQADTLFGKYLSEFEKRANPATLDTELKTYDTAAADLEKSLAENLAEQRAGLARARDLNLRKLVGDDERYSLSRGPLGTARSGEQERMFADAYYQAVLPYEQQSAALARANIGDVYSSRLSTAPLGRAATSQYLQLLTEPTGRLLTQAAQEQQNLAAAAGLLGSNRFSYSDDPRLTGQLPTPVAGYSVPGVPNYGGYQLPVRQPSLMPYSGPAAATGGGGTGGGGGFQPRPRSAADQGYYNQTGFWPDQDPNFSPEAYVRQGGRIGNQPAPYNPAAQQTQFNAAQQRADVVNRARAIADDNYRAQTGVDPVSDPYYNEEVWRAFYNEALQAGA